jgi:hypothetical protein
MQQQGMRRFGIILIFALAMAAVTATAGTYKLTDGTLVVGEPLSLKEDGIEFKQSDGNVTPRYSWDKLTPDALKALYAEAKTPHDRDLLKPLVADLPEDVAKPADFVIKPVETPGRPKGYTGLFALFGSSVGIVIVLVLYGANLMAAYEIAIYRRQPLSMVCGLAAVPVLGVLSPIVFISMPSKPVAQEAAEPAPTPAPAEGAAAPEPVAQTSRAAAAPSRAPIAMAGVEANPAPEASPAAPEFPEPIVFTRGDYTFNRRFFETKFPGFFRAIRAEAEKDLVLLFKTSRGEFVGRRITRITPNELYFQIFNNAVTADEMIPFIEVMEVQIRHKDAT